MWFLTQFRSSGSYENISMWRKSKSYDIDWNTFWKTNKHVTDICFSLFNYRSKGEHYFIWISVSNKKIYNLIQDFKNINFNTKTPNYKNSSNEIPSFSETYSDRYFFSLIKITWESNNYLGIETANWLRLSNSFSTPDKMRLHWSRGCKNLSRYSNMSTGKRVDKLIFSTNHWSV